MAKIFNKVASKPLPPVHVFLNESYSLDSIEDRENYCPDCLHPGDSQDVVVGYTEDVIFGVLPGEHDIRRTVPVFRRCCPNCGSNTPTKIFHDPERRCPVCGDPECYGDCME